MEPVIYWRDNKVYMLDQRLLPQEEKIVEHATHYQVAESISRMVIRGAPAIGVAAAMGIALGFNNLQSDSKLDEAFREISRIITATRPTAVNLFWAANRMERFFNDHKQMDLLGLKRKMIAEAQLIDQEDVEINRRLGANGAELLNDGDRIMTHCNAGALATAGYGTALGVVRAAVAAGKSIEVYANETRPFLQGARLTTWELQRDGIPVVLLTDSMAAHIMKTERINAVIVGADRIAANGDTANKIGTYSLAIAAAHHNIPFYVAAPMSTVDYATESGAGIPIEERPGSEVIFFQGLPIARPNTRTRHPAFDVTTATLIKAIITERGVAHPPFRESLATLAKNQDSSFS